MESKIRSGTRFLWPRDVVHDFLRLLLRRLSLDSPIVKSPRFGLVIIVS